MPETEVWTIGKLLTWTTQFLAARGSETPRLDAELLLAKASGCPRIQLYTSFNDSPSEQVRASFRDLVRRRAEGAPVAYLLGRREFYSLSFQVTPDVLVPRPETEHLLVGLLDLARQVAAKQSVSLADVGTGSGILAICAAKELPTAQVVALDKSPAALKVARANAQEHDVHARIEFVESDLFENIARQRQFDFIVSNPPYISTAEMAELPRDVREFEPNMALEAGEHGTEIIERLIPQAAEHLVGGGYLLIEISPQLQQRVVELLESTGDFDPAVVTKDLAGLPRVVQVRRKV